MHQRPNDNLKSYIVLGEAMPEGATVYVLRGKSTTAKNEISGSIELWAPLTGECYFFEENIAPSNMCS